VLLSSWPLVDYFRGQELHPRPLYFPPIAARRRTPGLGGARRKSPRLAVGFLGGKHRLAALENLVIPAIRVLAREGPVDLVVVAEEECWGQTSRHLLGQPGLNVRRIPADLSLELILRQLDEHGLDVLVHPNSDNTNNPYKTLNALLNADRLGAVPVVSDGPPFDEVRAEGIAVLCPDRSPDWVEALRAVRDDYEERQAILVRLAAFCDEHFGGQTNLETLRSILRADPLPGPARREARLRRALRVQRHGPPAVPVPPPSWGVSAAVRTGADVGRRVAGRSATRGRRSGRP
jgi:hypothetical protein